MARKTRKASILLVDDSPETLDVLERNLAALGYEVSTSAGAAEAVARLAAHPVDLVVTDLRMPGMSGIELVRHVRENLPDTAVMMITGYATIEGAVEAVKTGAEEYLAKPFTDEELSDAVERVLGKLKAHRDRRARASGGRFGLVGASDAFRRAIASLDRAFKETGPLLLLGEPGTGRSAAAYASAAARGRGQNPLLTIECGRLTGDIPAAYLSEGGLLYLRGLEWAGASSQERIFDLLSAHTLVGGRILFSAGPGLPVLVERGLFRGDLYGALSGSAITLPPLRERGEDVLLLAGHFVAELSERLESRAPEFGPAAVRALVAYGWPGNVEELKGAVMEAFTRSPGGTIEARDLPARVQAAAKEVSPLKTLAEAEREHILEALTQASGRKGRAAEILGIDRKTLREKLRGSTGEESPP